MVEIDIWELVGALAVMAAAITWLVRLALHQRGHEDLCARRYLQIEETHSALVKVSDERHRENRERFENLASTLDRQDDKLDRLLERRTSPR